MTTKPPPRFHFAIAGIALLAGGLALWLQVQSDPWARMAEELRANRATDADALVVLAGEQWAPMVRHFDGMAAVATDRVSKPFLTGANPVWVVGPTGDNVRGIEPGAAFRPSTEIQVGPLSATRYERGGEAP